MQATMIRALVMLPLTCAVASAACGSGVRYVDDDAGPDGDGLTWSTAYRFLPDALAEAGEEGSDVIEIRVAQGTYPTDVDEENPGGNGDPTRSFVLVSGVTMLGGYKGLDGGGDPDLRIPSLFETILTGELAGPKGDILFAYRVVTGVDLDATTLVDGLIVTKGQPLGPPSFDRGGGLYLEGGGPTIQGCVFEANGFDTNDGPPQPGPGGGLYAVGSNPRLIACMFDSNYTGNSGGGAYFTACAPTLIGCEFRNNLADDVTGGGGIACVDGTFAIIHDCLLATNRAHVGGGVSVQDSDIHITSTQFDMNGRRYSTSPFTAHGGGVFVSNSTCTVIGCEFVDNKCYSRGGGVSAFNDSEVVVLNTCFSQNAADEGGGIFTDTGSIAIRGCEFIDNGVAFNGAGIRFDGSGVGSVKDCLFVGNDSGADGGCIRDAPGFSATFANCRFLDSSTVGSSGGTIYGSPTLINCTISGSSATRHGSAIYGAPTLINCTVFGNGSKEGDSALALTGGTLRNTIVWGNMADQASDLEAQIRFVDGAIVDIDYCCIQGLDDRFDGVGNIGADPLYVDADGRDDIFGTEDDDVRLQPESPCADAGHNWLAGIDLLDLDGDGDTTELTPLDLDRDPRFSVAVPRFSDGCGTAAIIDIGAYEITGKPVDVVFADITGDGAIDVDDLVALLLAWGACEPGSCCIADLDSDDRVGVDDLVELLLRWLPG